MTPKDTITRFYDRLAAGDLNSAVELLADEVDLAVPGAPTIPWLRAVREHGGPATPRVHVAEFLTDLMKHLRATEFVVDTVLADGPEVAAFGHFRFVITATDRSFTSRFAVRTTVASGLITRYHFFEDTWAVAHATGA